VLQQLFLPLHADNVLFALAQAAMAAAHAQEAAAIAAIAAAPAAAFNATSSTLRVNVSLPVPPATELLAPPEVPLPGSAW
jgi:hypothetical protein